MASGFTMLPYTCPRDYGGKKSKPQKHDIRGDARREGETLAAERREPAGEDVAEASYGKKGRK